MYVCPICKSRSTKETWCPRHPNEPLIAESYTGGLPYDVHKGCTIDEFWASLPANTQEKLQELDANGYEGAIEYVLAGIGKVRVYIDACSEGADRGGYVRWYELVEFDNSDGPHLLLEEVGNSEILFAGRSTVAP